MICLHPKENFSEYLLLWERNPYRFRVVSKWWQNCNFQMNYPFKTMSQTKISSMYFWYICLRISMCKHCFYPSQAAWENWANLTQNGFTVPAVSFSTQKQPWNSATVNEPEQAVLQNSHHSHTHTHPCAIPALFLPQHSPSVTSVDL